jgi:hypothetical protein
VAIRRHIKKQALGRQHPQPNALVLAYERQKIFFRARKPGEYKRDARFCEVVRVDEAWQAG